MRVTGEASCDVRIHAIVPAAGRSRRMGAPKGLLDVGGQPMLARVVEPLRAASLQGVLVVTNAELAPRVEAMGYAVTVNSFEDAEMIDSVRLGIAWWEHEAELLETDGYLVCPGDQPGLEARHIEQCLETFRRDPARIVIASHAGRRGHPLIFPTELGGFVKSAACNTGLNQLPRRHPDRVEQVELDTEAVVRNVNTPEDYGKIR